MLGDKEAKRIIEQALGYAKEASQAEVMLNTEESALTRFANNYIHQNVAESNTRVSVRIVLGKKIGVAGSNDLSTEGLRKTVENAMTIARFQEENADFVSLPEPREANGPNSYIASTAAASPELRADAVAIVCNKAKEAGLIASGAFNTNSGEIAVGNSLGVRAYAPYSKAAISTVIMGDDSSGWADRASTDVRDINAEELAAEAVGKAQRSQNPQRLEPGDYDVILEEYAVAEMLEYMNYIGINALAVQEGRSFMKIGEKIAGDNITLIDDPLDPSGFPFPFDFEGYPRQRITVIENGIAMGVPYDSYTANREGKPEKNNGHALPAPNTYGPVAINMFLAPGDSSKEEMLKQVKRGVWVSRFHYVNISRPLPPTLTGMTRDGTFLIENGEITTPLRNFRFTQDVLAALSNTSAISRTTKLQEGFFGGTRVPALLVRNFHFSGVTEF